MKQLKIGELAKQSGIRVETLRYYEKRGLLPEPKRLESGYRVYTPETLERLNFIKRSKELGFSLDEIGELLQLDTNPEGSAAEVKSRVEEKITLVRDKIRDLQRIEHSLMQLSGLCCGEGSTSECPILEYLHEGKGCHHCDNSPEKASV